MTNVIRTLGKSTNKICKNPLHIPIPIPIALKGYITYLQNQGQISAEIGNKVIAYLLTEQGSNRFHTTIAKVLNCIAGIMSKDKIEVNSPILLAKIAKKIVTSPTAKKYARIGVTKGANLARKGLNILEKKTMSKLNPPLISSEEGKKTACPYCGSLQIVGLYKGFSKKPSKFYCLRCKLTFSAKKITTRQAFFKKHGSLLMPIEHARDNAPKTAQITLEEVTKFSVGKPKEKLVKVKVKSKVKVSPKVKQAVKSIEKKKTSSTGSGLTPINQVKQAVKSLSGDISKTMIALKKLTQMSQARDLRRIVENLRSKKAVSKEVVKPKKVKEEKEPNPPLGREIYGFVRRLFIRTPNGQELAIEMAQKPPFKVYALPGGAFEIVGKGANKFPYPGAKLLAIEARKGTNSLWANKLFRHDFNTKPVIRIVGDKIKVSPKRTALGNPKNLHKIFNY